MPRKKRGVENKSSITSFEVWDMGETAQSEEVLTPGSEEMTLTSLKEVILEELSKVTGELKILGKILMQS